MKKRKLYILGASRCWRPACRWSRKKKSPPDASQQIGSRFFLVDPLDGTKEFINRNGEFTVNIAEIANGIAGARRRLCAGEATALFIGDDPGRRLRDRDARRHRPDLASARPIHVRSRRPTA